MLKKWVALLSIIVGIVFLISPVAGVTAISILSGLILTALGVWMFINGLMARKYMEVSIFWIIFAIISISIGLMLVFRVFLINQLAGAWLIVTGILLLVAGILILAASPQSYLKRNGGIISAIFGLIYIIIGALSFDARYIGVVIGLILIVYGVMVLRAP